MEIRTKALVVDDEEGVRLVIGAMLEECGCLVSCAGDGYQALEQLDSFEPDIVFTDLNMPGMSGLELIVRLKDRIPDIPIVVVSGTGDIQYAIEAIRRGAWEYVIKPVGVDSIHLVTNRALERARLIRENRAYEQRLEEMVMNRTRELRDSEIRYRTLFDTANDAIVLIHSGIIQSCNLKTGQLFGTDPAEIIGHSILSCAPPWRSQGNDATERYAEYERRALEGAPQFYEWRYYRRDGAFFDAEISLNRVELHGEPHLLAIMRDVTERKKAAAALLENAFIKRELDMAREIQRQLLPGEYPTIPDLSLAGGSPPTAGVGGDYYDFFTITPDILDVVIADVAGHSIGSALLMSEARSVLHAKARIERPPAILLAAVNELMHDDLSRSELQMSIFAARFDMQKRTLAYANAGHTRPLLYRASSGAIEQLDAEGMLLGIMREPEFEERECALAAGDILLLHTDGLAEAENSSGEFFGTERLCRLLAAQQQNGPEEILAAIFTELAAFTENSALSDDVSLVALKVGNHYCSGA